MELAFILVGLFAGCLVYEWALLAVGDYFRLTPTLVPMALLGAVMGEVVYRVHLVLTSLFYTAFGVAQ